MSKIAIIQARNFKIRYILYGFWGFLFVLSLRLFYLQIEKGMGFLKQGEKNFLRLEIIPPLRGDVYDCQHTLLAANRPVFDLYWHGIGRKKLSDQDMRVLEKVSDILGIDLCESSMKNSIEYAEKFGRRILLRGDVKFQQLCQISEQCSDAYQLVIANQFKRIYLHNQLASHVLGYLNRGENVGQAGIEFHFEQALQGEEGCLLQVINSTGKMLAQKVYKEAKAGQDIVLTLDAQLQRLVETLFEAEQSGAFILMDPETGAIKALASHPNFDPNIFLNPLSHETWGNLIVNNPLLNRATVALYPPASLFKLVTFAAALEEKMIDPNSEVICNGHITYGGRRYYCMRRLGHGRLTPKEALAVSCNIPCYQIAKRLKIDRLALYAHRLGLGRKTNFLLPEKAGLVPTTAWKRVVKGERWWQGETLSVCIGQGALQATPLQMARMVSAICTEFLVKPRLLEHEQIERERLELSHETVLFLRNGMKEAVDDGSGRRLGNMKSFDVYVKTGTAQTCGLERERLYKNQIEHGWVAGYFFYKHQKPLTMVVVLEHAGSSSFAVQLAQKFLRGYRNIMEEKTLSKDAVDAKT